eukprot:g15154.t1
MAGRPSTQTLVAVNKAMEDAVEEMENTTWEHLRQGLGVGNPFVSQIIRVRGSLSGTYEKSRIILPLYFKNIDKAMSISLLRKNVRSNFYETDYMAFLEDVRLLATNAEKYNGTADVVTNAAWDLYKIAENYDPYKTTTRRSVSLTNSKSSAAAGSSGALPPQRRKKSTKDRHTGASDLANNKKRSVNLEKKSLSRKEAVKKLEGLAIRALQIARNTTAANTENENQPNTSDERFIDNIVKRTGSFSLDEAYATIFKTWQNAILSYTSIDFRRLDALFVAKQIKGFLRVTRLPVSGKKRDCSKRLIAYITKLQNESWKRNEVCAKSVLELFKKYNSLEVAGSGRMAFSKCLGPDATSTNRCNTLAKASVVDCNIHCSFCDSKSIRLGQVARSRDLSPIFSARGMMCKPQIISSADTIAATFKFDDKTLPLTSMVESSRNYVDRSTFETVSKGKDFGSRFQVWIRLFPVLMGNEHSNLIDVQRAWENKNRCLHENFLFSVNEKTIYARELSANNNASHSQLAKTITHNNGDIDISSDINLGEGNIIKVALIVPHQASTFNHKKYICSVDLIEKVTLDKIKESVKKLSFLEGKTWVKTYFAKKSKGIEIPFVNMSLKCPLSTGRLVCPVRTVTCKHLQCFDLETFWNYSVMMSQANKSAKCPICKAPASVGDVQICGYTEEVLSVASTKDVENAVIFPDGRYRIDIKGADKNSKKRKRNLGVDKDGVDKDGCSSTNTENNAITNTVILLSSDDEEDSDKCSGSEHPHDDKDRFMPNSANECLSNNGLQVDSTSVGISRTGSSYDDAIVLD